MTKLVISVVLLFTSVLCFAGESWKEDMSGAWRLSYTSREGGQTASTDFVVLKTDRKLGSAALQFPYYIVQAKRIGRMDVIGLVLSTDPDGTPRIHWQRFVENGSTIHLDGESNMVLNSEGETLILGGDFEKYEVARMTRLYLLAK